MDQPEFRTRQLKTEIKETKNNKNLKETIKKTRKKKKTFAFRVGSTDRVRPLADHQNIRVFFRYFFDCWVPLVVHNFVKTMVI